MPRTIETIVYTTEDAGTPKTIDNSKITDETKKWKFADEANGITIPGKFNQIDMVLTLPTDDKTIANGNKVDVVWKEDGSDKTNTAVSGTATIDGKILKITNLRLKGDFKFQFWGTIEIGEDKKPGAKISVSIGNMEPGYGNDWVLNFSSKRKPDDTGTQIKVTDLITWIQSKSKEKGQPALPQEIGDKKEYLGKLEVNFEDFWFNITRRTFKIDVKTTGELKFANGDFVIKDLGLILTNQPAKEDYDKLKLKALATDDKKSDKAETPGVKKSDKVAS